MNEVMIEFASVECEDPLVIEDTKPLACRCCLATERPLQPLDLSQASLYHQLTGTTVSPSDIYPKFLCNYCCALLIKFSDFKRKCLSAQETLCYLHSGSIPITKELLNSGVAGSPYPQFTITITQLISLDSHEQFANTSTSNDLDENKVLYEHQTFQGEVQTAVEHFDVCPKTENNEEIITVADADTVSEDDASDMPDCLVGLNTDIYTKDSKKPFKDELIEATKGKIQRDFNDRPEAAYSKKVKADNAKVRGKDIPFRAKTQIRASKAGQNIKQLNSDKIYASIVEETKKIINHYKAKNSTNKKKCINREVNQETTPKLQASSSQENSKEVVMVNDGSELSDGNKEGNDKAEKTSSKPSFSVKEMQEFIRKIKSDNEKRNIQKVKKSLLEQRKDMLKQSFLRKYNVTIISLSKEEQIKQFMARKDAPRYKKSKYKCELCYTGFPFEYRYKIHMDEHHLKGGSKDMICDVCNNTRYASKNRKKHEHSFNYKCNECGFISTAKHTALIHYNTHRGKTYDCKICGKVFNRPTSVFGHMHLSHGGTEECPICSLKFIGRIGLRFHMSLSHKEAVDAVCGTCGVQFHSHDALRRHLPQDGIGSCDHTHRPCAACGEGFPTEELLQQHKQEHHRNDEFRTTPEQDLMCEVCGAVRKNRKLLESHMRTHNKPYQCDYCQRGFPVKKSLEKHISIHLASPEAFRRTILCHYCPKTFYNFSTRQSHEYRTHNLIYKADVENRKSNLKASRRTFSCRYCPNNFNHLQSRARHENLYHPQSDSNKKRTKQNEFQENGVHMCHLCGSITPNRARLLNHIACHTKLFQCDHCQRRFAHKCQLKDHISKKHMDNTDMVNPQKQYACEICSKTFNFLGNKVRHVKGVHLKEKTHKCDVCEGLFFTKSELTNHINTKHLGMPWPKRIRNRRRQK